MANTIKIRRNTTASSVPTTTQLDQGELAVNVYDGKLFFKKVQSGVESIVTLQESAASGITSLNSQTGATQTFAVGSAGNSFAISSSANTHTFNLPAASATATGVVTTGTQTIAGQKNLTDLTGINEASPGGQLQVTSGAAARKPLVVKGAASQSANLLELQNSSATNLFSINNNGTVAQMTAGSGSSAYLQLNANFAWVRLGRAFQQFGNFTGGYVGAGDDGVAFSIRMGAALDAEAMRVEGKTAGTTAAPRVGFGETSLTAQVHVKTADAARKAFIVKGATSQSANLLEVQDSAGTAKAYTRADGSQVVSLAATDTNAGITSIVTNNGYTCLGLWQQASTSGGVSQYLAALYSSSGLVGSITHNGTSSAFNTSSDYRLKENLAPLLGAIQRLSALPVHRFNFKADPSRTVDGCLAHEVAQVVPEAVVGAKDGVDADGNLVPQAVDYSKLVPLLVASVKELSARVTSLEQQLISTT